MYDMSRRSFNAFSAQMNTAGQNIANANTPGYARRRITLEPTGPMTQGVLMRRNGAGVSGGVSVQSFERMRDGLLAAQSWEAQAGLGGADEEARLLGAVEGVFGVGSGASLNDVMDGFWTAWGDLANDPTDPTVRSSLLARSESVASTLNELDADLERLGTQTQSVLRDGVADANGLLEELAGLNVAVRSARAAGSPDLAAEDRRDAAVAELAAFAPVRVADETDGYHITVGGMTVLQGDEPQLFRYQEPTGTEDAAVLFGNTDVAVPASSDGKLGAWVRTINETIPGTRAQLDGFAASLVTSVNAEHNAGFGLDGSTGLDFFDPAGLGAGSIRLSADVADPDAIAAAGAADAPGDSDAANGIAALREGFDTEATSILTGVGSRLQQARTAVGAHGAVADHLAAMERAVSGVNMDEEMTKLIEAQQAFAASARVLNTVEEMVDTLFSI